MTQQEIKDTFLRSVGGYEVRDKYIVKKIYKGLSFTYIFNETRKAHIFSLELDEETLSNPTFKSIEQLKSFLDAFGDDILYGEQEEEDERREAYDEQVHNEEIDHYYRVGRFI